jgi:hypothetical protein
VATFLFLYISILTVMGVSKSKAKPYISSRSISFLLIT